MVKSTIHKCWASTTWLTIVVLLITARSSAAQTCYACAVCLGDNQQHYVGMYPETFYGPTVIHYNCYPNKTCEEDNPTWCAGFGFSSEQEYLDFLTNVISAEGPDLILLLSQLAEVVSYNPQRGAVQVPGCGKVLIASIPLRPSQQRALDHMYAADAEDTPEPQTTTR